MLQTHCLLKKLELKEIGRDQPVFSFTGSVFQTALANWMFLSEITFLLPVPDFQAPSNGVVFTDWIY